MSPTVNEAGPRAAAAPRRSLFALIQAQACARPGAPAIGAPGRRPLSYRALAREVARTLDGLAAAGVRPGSCVALALPDGPDLAVACLGVAAGAVAAPLDPRATEAELDASLTALDARAVIVPEGSGGAVRRAAGARGLTLLELVPRPSAPAGVFDLRAARQARRAAGAPAGPGDPALRLRTSGTTGVAKVVSLAHDQLQAAAGHVVQALALTDRDRGLVVMPLSHGHGLIAGLLAPLAAGGLVVCPGRFSALQFPAWLAGARPTWYTAVPAMHRATLGLLDADNPGLSTLRLVRSASSPLAPALLAELEATLGVPVIEAYGMTEAAHQIASNPLPPRARKPGSVGLPLGVEVTVVDEAGAPLPPGRLGEIRIRGRTVSRAIAPPGTWLPTGDLGYLDPDGYLFLAGRRDEMINRGGEKVAPAEVDAVLLAHPAVADAVTVPQADPGLGEVAAALVVLSEPGAVTADRLRSFAAARLAPPKVPRRIVLVPEIPREATGKVARRRLARAFGLDGSGPTTPGTAGDSLEARLLALVCGWVTTRDARAPEPLTAGTSLVRSGVVDSLALVELAAWVEDETGGPLAPAEAARLAACDTVADFVAFARGRGVGPRRRAPRPAGPARSAPPARPTSRPPRAGYAFTPYRPDLRGQILDLQTHLWNPDRAVNAAYFEWKYERNPYLETPLIYLACRGAEVVAMRGFFGGRWEAGPSRQAIDILSAGDLVVAPAHRGRGLVPRLMRLAHADLGARGHALALNLSAGGATYLASLRTGWRTTPSLERLERRTGRPGAATPIPPPADPFAALDAAAGGAGGPLRLAAAPRPAAMAALIARLPYDGRLRHVRDARYFAWRFRNPLSRYRFLYWHERRLEGYLVLRAPARPRDRRVQVADWEARTPRIRAALLEAALEWGRFPDVRTWVGTLDAETRRLLGRHGFRPPLQPAGRPRPHASTLLVKALGPRRAGAWTLAGRPLLDLASWDLRMLYSDAV